MKLEYVLFVVLVQQLTWSFHQGTVLRLKKILKNTLEKCSLKYSFCVVQPTPLKIKPVELDQWATWNTSHKWAICTNMHLSKNRKKSSKAKQSFSTYKLLRLEECKLVYSETEDHISCRKFFLFFQQSLFLYPQKTSLI